MRYFFALIFLLTAFSAIFSMEKYEEYGMVVFENPADISNSLVYFSLIIAFTALILILARHKAKLLEYLIYFVTFLSIFYVLLPFIDIFSLPVAILMLFLLVKRPNLLSLNASAFVLAVGVTVIFGISLEPLPATLLLFILATYDAISVYKTAHMMKLADSVSKINAPMLFIVRKGEERMVMGVGDVVVPNILAVSAQKFSASPYLFFIKFSALFTILGSLAGLIVLLYLLEKKKGAHAGLPFLNSGAILGFLASHLI